MRAVSPTSTAQASLLQEAGTAHAGGRPEASLIDGIRQDARPTHHGTFRAKGIWALCDKLGGHGHHLWRKGRARSGCCEKLTKQVCRGRWSRRLKLHHEDVKVRVQPSQLVIQLLDTGLSGLDRLLCHV